MPSPPFTGSPCAVSPSKADPSPPAPPPGRTVRIAARVVLWTLIGIASLRGVLPPPAAPGGSGPNGAPAQSPLGPQRPGSQASVQDEIAMATAAAFLREYLTVDQRRAERPGRLKRYLARGVDVDDGVVPERDVSQSTDLVLPVGVQPLRDGMEVTVLAHLLRSRGGLARDGGTVVFVVPIISGPGGVAVAGIPRPATLPVDPALTSRPVALPTALARATAVAAGQTVAALLDGNRAALVRLGGGAAPMIRPFPDGWRPLGITAILPAGPPGRPTAQVLVRARPPIAGVEYIVPVRVSLRPGAGTPTVREVDAGGTP
jgi:hypothetical protein